MISKDQLAVYKRPFETVVKVFQRQFILYHQLGRIGTFNNSNRIWTF